MVGHTQYDLCRLAAMEEAMIDMKKIRERRDYMTFCTNRTGLESMHSLLDTLNDTWHKARYTYTIAYNLPNPEGTTPLTHRVYWKRIIK